MNSLLLDSMPERTTVEKEEEVISLQPIGRGVQNLEPSAQSPGIKTSPVTSSFPTDGLNYCMHLLFSFTLQLLCFCTTLCSFSLTTALHVFVPDKICHRQ